MNRILNSRFSRKYNVRKERKLIYIFTEGKETEVNYFESKKQEIRKINVKIKITGTGFNTLSLVNYVLDYISEEGIKIDDSADSDECWVVFDKDDFDRDFDNAINKAIKNNIKVAYSNESFELWFLLHFSYFQSGVDRRVITKKLTDIIQKNYGEKYEKRKGNMYSLVKDLEQAAIKNAKCLLESYGNERSYLKKNPSTTVHLLVESLNKLK